MFSKNKISIYALINQHFFNLQKQQTNSSMFQNKGFI